MEQVRFLVRYAGEWEKKDSTYQYDGGIMKGITVPKNISYIDLVEKIHDLTKIDHKTHSIKLKVMYHVNQPLPVEIEGDYDLEYFISENIDRSSAGTYICISSIPRQNANDERSSSDSEMRCGYDWGGHQYVLESQTSEDTSNSDSLAFGRGMDVELEPILPSNNCHDIDEAQPSHPAPYQAATDKPPKYEPSSGAGSNSLVESSQGSVSEVSSGRVKVGELFREKRMLYRNLCMYAMKKHFQFRVVKSTRDLFVAGCLKSNCKWWLRATRLKDTSFFMIKKFCDVHASSACLEYNRHRQATGWVIGEEIKWRYEGVGVIYRPNDIRNDFQTSHGVSITYGKAWRARESALSSLYGSPEDSFAQLPRFFAQLEARNPGSITHIARDSDNHFEYCFMAIGACLSGFHSSIRPVICIDGTHLKGKYMGTLFIATSLDGNNQVFPLAFGVGPSETYASWGWFLSKLRAALGDVGSLVIVSDRHKAIQRAVAEVYPDALHAFCIYHLSQNLMAKRFKKTVVPLFYSAAKCYRIVDFDNMMDEIKLIDQGQVYEYLLDIGFDKWSRAHFPGDRYDIMTTNIAECLNAVFKDARNLPITMLMEHIRAKLQTWFYDRRTEAAAMPSVATKHWDDILCARREKGATMIADPISIHEFHVRGGGSAGHVDLSSKTCSCRVFDIDKLPCVHACVACGKRDLPIHSMCSHYFMTEMLILAYADPILLVLAEETWPTLDQAPALLPPTAK